MADDHFLWHQLEHHLLSLSFQLYGTHACKYDVSPLTGNENEDENYSALPEHVTQPSAAVLLSPVVRKTRVQEESQLELEPLKPSEWCSECLILLCQCV